MAFFYLVFLNEVFAQERIEDYQVILDVSKNGLPGDHHFYITFNMSTEGIVISEDLKEKYPDEMTIVIQNWYDGFIVNNFAFTITLNFGNVRETMEIPFLAIKTFVDPSVKFGLSFESHLDISDKLDNKNETNASDDEEGKGITESTDVSDKKSGDVVSLESFRKS